MESAKVGHGMKVEETVEKLSAGSKKLPDFEKTEMKYDSTGMFHWTPPRSIDDCILVSTPKIFK